MSDMHRHLPGHSTWGGGADWRDEAACLGIDPELFFPVGNTGLVAGRRDPAPRPGDPGLAA